MVFCYLLQCQEILTICVVLIVCVTDYTDFADVSNLYHRIYDFAVLFAGLNKGTETVQVCSPLKRTLAYSP